MNNFAAKKFRKVSSLWDIKTGWKPILSSLKVNLLKLDQKQIASRLLNFYSFLWPIVEVEKAELSFNEKMKESFDKTKRIFW